MKSIQRKQLTLPLWLGLTGALKKSKPKEREENKAKFRDEKVSRWKTHRWNFHETSCCNLYETYTKSWIKLNYRLNIGFWTWSVTRWGVRPFWANDQRRLLESSLRWGVHRSEKFTVDFTHTQIDRGENKAAGCSFAGDNYLLAVAHNGTGLQA